MQKNDPYLIAERIVLTIIVVYPFLLIWQGLDFTDMGFNLSNQQLFFEKGYNLELGNLYYLSNFIGGLWLILSEPFGLVGARFGWVVLILSNALISRWFLIKALKLKTDKDRFIITLGVFFAFLWITKEGGGNFYISYNWLTGTLFMFGAIYLYKAITEKAKVFLIISGAIFGLSIFARMPNIVSASIILSIPFYFFDFSNRKKNLKIITNYTFSFVLGYLIAIVLVYILMSFFGHSEAYITEIKETLFAASTNSEHHHSIIGLATLLKEQLLLSVVSLATISTILIVSSNIFLNKQKYQFAFLLFVLLLTTNEYKLHIITQIFHTKFVIVIGLIFIFLIIFLLHKFKRKVSPLYVLAIIFFVVIGMVYLDTNLRDRVLLFGILTVSLLYVAFHEKEKNQKLLIGLSVFIMWASFIGSGNGLYNAIFGSWLSLPLLIYCISRTIKIETPFLKLNEKLFITIIIISTVTLFSLYKSYTYIYRDMHNRSLLTSQVNHPKLKWVFTTKERALVVEEMLKELDNHIIKGDYLLSSSSNALVYYLTNTKPILNAVWTLYAPKDISKLDQFPVILFSKGSTRNRNWPTEKKLYPQTIISNRQIKQLIDKNKYKKVWENDFFEIWKI